MSSPENARAPESTAGPRASRLRRCLPLSIAAAYLLLALGISSRYGPTSDCAFGDYAYGEATWRALQSFADPVEVYAEGSPAREGHPHYESNFRWHELFPLASTLGAACCDLFWERWHWLAPTAAHHLALVALAGAMLFALVRFAEERGGGAVAVLGALFLLSSPRFFADLQHNLKDAPAACLYTCCAIAFYRAHEGLRSLPWLITGALAGLALAQKQNALLLPLHFAIALVAWRICLHSPGRPDARARMRNGAIALVACALAYGSASPWLWHDSSRLLTHWSTVLGVGRVGSIVSWEGPRMLLHATPEPLLVLAALGAVAPGLSVRLRIFLLAWIGTSLGRLLLPGMLHYDGVRHFLEVYPPLALLAAAGVRFLARLAGRSSCRGERFALATLGALALFPGVAATIATHPYGTTYFNVWCGGLHGARQAELPDAGDYWATSYWEASAWLSVHAPHGVPIVAGNAPAVLRACSPERLRADLRILDARDEIAAPCYVVYVTRQAGYSAFLSELDRTDLPPVHEIRVQGEPILKIHHLPDAAALERFAEARRRDRWSEAGARVLHWAEADPERARVMYGMFLELQQHGFDAVLPRFRAFLPEELRSVAEDALRFGVEAAQRERERAR